MPWLGSDGCGVSTVTQQAISQRFASCRRASSESRATKAVICRMKSMSTASAAYRAKDFTAGIVLKAPAKRQRDHVYLSRIRFLTNLNLVTAFYVTHSVHYCLYYT